MDNVLLLDRHLKDFTYQIIGTEIVGGFPTEEKILKEIPFKAVPLPMNAEEIKMYSQGSLTYESLKIYTKKLLNKDLDLEDIKLTKEVIVRNSNGKQYEVFDKKDYEEIADLVVYILKAVE